MYDQSFIKPPLIAGEHIRIAGGDATDFLQNIVSNDITAMKQESMCYAVLLTPQAKIICDVFLIRLQKDEYILVIAAQFMTSILPQLRLFARRRDVVIEHDNRFVITHRQDNTLDNNDDYICRFDDPRMPHFWQYYLRDCKHEKALHCDYVQYNIKRLLNGLLEAGLEYPTRQLFLHEANIDYLNGVNFNKGCYIGQEVVSHMHYKANVKKRLLLFSYQQEEALRLETPIYSEEKRVGKVINEFAGLQEEEKTRYALGLVRIGKSENLATLFFKCNNLALHLVNLTWMQEESMA